MPAIGSLHWQSSSTYSPPKPVTGVSGIFLSLHQICDASYESCASIAILSITDQAVLILPPLNS